MPSRLCLSFYFLETRTLLTLYFLKISTINSRGFNSNDENLICDRAKSFVFFLIQETLITDADSIKNISSHWPGASYWSPAIGSQGGVCILVNENFQGKIINWRCDTDGRVLSLLFDLRGSKFNLVNIYAPAVLTDRNVLFESLHQYFIPADYIILGGNFNCYENHLDKFGGNVKIANYLPDFRKNFNFIYI